MINDGGRRMNLWTKRLDVMHRYEPGKSATVCGKPMLGNNYATFFKEGQREKCKECWEGLK